MKRIALNERLQLAQSQEPNFLAAFELYLDTYFYDLTSISGNDYFSEIYEAEFQHREECRDIFLAELVYNADKFSPALREKLLYKILIEPFAMIEKERWEK